MSSCSLDRNPTGKGTLQTLCLRSQAKTTTNCGPQAAHKLTRSRAATGRQASALPETCSQRQASHRKNMLHVTVFHPKFNTHEGTHENQCQRTMHITNFGLKAPYT
eukprot:1160701-Pelagomonas_calceolata.AAC.9